MEDKNMRPIKLKMQICEKKNRCKSKGRTFPVVNFNVVYWP